MTGLELADAINNGLQDVVATLESIDDALGCIPSDTAIIAGMLLTGTNFVGMSDDGRARHVVAAVETARLVLCHARQSNPARVVADMQTEGNGDAKV